MKNVCPKVRVGGRGQLGREAYRLIDERARSLVRVVLEAEWFVFVSISHFLIY